MDLRIQRKTWGIDDTSWLASRHGLDTGRSITLDVTAFTKATHYPEGFLLSGLPLARNASGEYVPYDSAGIDSTGTLDGHLLGAIHISGSDEGETVPERVGGALLWQGVIDARFLPVAVDATGMADVNGRIRYENVEG